MGHTVRIRSRAGLLQGGGNPFLRGAIQPRVHGQAHRPLRHGVAHGQAGNGVGHGGSLVERDGVMHGGGYAGGLEFFLHCTPVTDLNGVLRPGTGVVGCYTGCGDVLALTVALSRVDRGWGFARVVVIEGRCFHGDGGFWCCVHFFEAGHGLLQEG